jgi:hypothetical protein
MTAGSTAFGCTHAATLRHAANPCSSQRKRFINYTRVMAKHPLRVLHSCHSQWFNQCTRRYKEVGGSLLGPLRQASCVAQCWARCDKRPAWPNAGPAVTSVLRGPIRQQLVPQLGKAPCVSTLHTLTPIYSVFQLPRAAGDAKRQAPRNGPTHTDLSALHQQARRAQHLAPRTRCSLPPSGLHSASS